MWFFCIVVSLVFRFCCGCSFCGVIYSSDFAVLLVLLVLLALRCFCLVIQGFSALLFLGGLCVCWFYWFSVVVGSEGWFFSVVQSVRFSALFPLLILPIFLYSCFWWFCWLCVVVLFYWVFCAVAPSVGFCVVIDSESWFWGFSELLLILSADFSALCAVDSVGVVFCAVHTLGFFALYYLWLCLCVAVYVW